MTPEDILDFWLGTLRPDGTVEPEISARWWRKDPAFDDEIRTRFGEFVDRAGTGALDDWAKSARGRVALVVLLDQFPRNLHRGSGRAFEHDPRARAHAVEALDSGQDREVPPMLAYFLYMPLMHSESLEDQDRCVRAFDEAAARAPDGPRKALEGGTHFARKHRDIVARFGRFPHRNAALGRESTPEEVDFLKQPGSSF